MDNLNRAILVSVLTLCACRDSKLGSGECETVTGGITNTDYEFKDHNYSCQEGAILPRFNLDTYSFFDFGGLAESDVESDFDVAAAAWTAAADLTIGRDAFEVATYLDQDDGYNAFFMQDGADFLDDGFDMLAVTVSTDVGSDGLTDDCDVVVYTTKASNSSTINWVANDSPAFGERDLTVIMAHEMGHCIGIADQEAPSTSGDLMFGSPPTSAEFAGLAVDDDEAAVYLYGPP